MYVRVREFPLRIEWSRRAVGDRVMLIILSFVHNSMSELRGVIAACSR